MAYKTKKQRERKEQAKTKAAHLHTKANHQLEHSNDSVQGIPLGQPILRNHHSEQRHRKAIETAQRKTSQAVETHEAAKSAEWSARNSGHAITSDDPEAIIALESKLKDLEEGRDQAKAINKAYKKSGEQGLRDIGVSEAHIERLLKTISLCPWIKKPCDTTNTSAKIRSVKKRIEELQTANERPEAKPIEGNGFTIEEDKNDGRIRFYFDERPDRDTCKKMRRAGFKFSRTNEAWQRLLNANGRHAALQVAKELFV